MLELAHHIPAWAIWLILVVAVSGIVFATLYYLVAPKLPGLTAKIFKPLHVLFFRKWFFDEIYDVLIVKPLWALGRVFSAGDRKVIDGIGPDGVSKVTQVGARVLSKIQTGFVYHYAFLMIVGLVVLIAWLLIERGAF